MSEVGLSLAGVSAGYRGRPVISDLELGPIRPGEVTALAGPNGAGKSTLLRVIAGLLPARGRISLDGRALADLRDRSSRIALMPQALPQRVSLTVVESVIVALRGSDGFGVGRSSTDSVRQAVAVIDRLDIGEIAEERMDRLSGGQRQLASLAQALVRQPSVLLLDEPTSALDLRHQITVMGLLRGLAKEGRIVVVVLHDLALAARWADRIAVLREGRLRVFGDPDASLHAAVLADTWGVDAQLLRSPRGNAYLDVR